ncbi:MAG: hypothetical protein KR126chlam2_00227 [Chlamydiae bacterium]|nr:hypothetical protein [Chlamydiota bacterium]
MDVSGVDKIGSIKGVDRKTPVQTAQICDELNLSEAAQIEAVKLEEWVEQLKAMPDIRHEALERATSIRETPDIRKALAEKLLAEG